jgi:SAM-dependent methyltransferase
MSTDSEWEKWGKRDPYFGVFTDDKYRSKNLTEDALQDFFDSGRDHLNHVLQAVRHHFDHGFCPKRALDFGCGTGRVVIPLAGIAQQVVGVDVSESMLIEARNNCDRFSARNVALLKSDDDLTSLDGYFDFIHSFVVLQHIPVERGRRIFNNLMRHLAHGGICAIHVTYSKAKFRNHYGAVPMRKARDSLRGLKQLVRRMLPNKDPEMQMNHYNVNELLFLMQESAIGNFFTEYTNHGGQLGLFLYFQKPAEANAAAKAA